MKEKLKSRKFMVWITWGIISIIALFQPDLPKETIYQYFGLISMVYISANAAQKFMPTGNKCGPEN